ncbi:hypothetical protein APHAL10511_006079 [Amanita phalloides]|nr:hypothetical protein APHAL10511_006079 [Amanita phalloides]
MSDDVAQEGIAFYVLAASLSLILYILSREKNLDSIPTVGPSSVLLSYFSALRFLLDATGTLRDGYQRFKPGIFKVASFNQWIVVVCGAKFVEELRKAPDGGVSCHEEAIDEILQVSGILGKDTIPDQSHVHVLSAQLTRNIHFILPEICDEFSLAIREYIPSAEQGWTPVLVLETMARIVTRVSNRAFVGAPLCRDPEYVRLCKTFAMQELSKTAMCMKMFPKSTRALAYRIVTRLPSHTNKLRALLEPVIVRRIMRIESYGKDYPRRPNDLMQWLLMDSPGHRTSSKDIVSRILAVNARAIRTSCMIMTQVLFHLAARPRHMETMRKEVEYVVKTEGWTKDAADQLNLMDSFIKETMRLNDACDLSMMRKTTKPFAFSNGVVIPEGTMLYAASHPVHFDPEIYPKAEEFDGFRFEKLMDHDSLYFNQDKGSRYQLVATSPYFLAWGHGKHACPGRFFAAVELKIMLAHLILNYDIQFEGADAQASSLANWKKDHLLFRRRERV